MQLVAGLCTRDRLESDGEDDHIRHKAENILHGPLVSRIQEGGKTMKWFLIAVASLFVLDAIILLLMHRHIRYMEKQGFKYNYELERWEKDEAD